MKASIKDFEIMAPVGSRESLAAAIQAGADSIYFGIESLNMRARSASTFTVNDLREMGRATSAMLKGMDYMDERVVLVATTNLYEHFDKALVRRFDAVIDFNRYTKEDLISIAEEFLNKFLSKFKLANKDIRLFRKIIGLLDPIPYPGDLKNLIKTAVAFSDPDDGMDYFRRLYYAINNKQPQDLKELQSQKFTIREIEILSKISKSTVARELKEGIDE